MDDFAPKAIEHFNKAAKSLVTCIVPFNPPQPEFAPSKSMSSSYKDIQIIDLSNMGARLQNLRIEFADKLDQIYKSTDRGWNGIDKNSIADFSKLVRSILTKVDWIDYPTLESIVFEWIVNEHLEQDQEDLITYLDSWKKEHVRVYEIFFLIKNLAIETPFQLGRAFVTFYTEEGLDSLFDSLKYKINRHRKKLIKSKFVGSVVVACRTSNGEINLAKEVAFEECALSVDALKLFSVVIEDPNRYVTFDLDSRTLDVIYEQDILAVEVHQDRQLMRLNYSFTRPRPSQFTIDNDYMRTMSGKGIGYIHNFLVGERKSELSQLIIQSIKYFASALSQRDLHKRIVDVFTVMESLVLRNDDEGILHSLTTYVPKILTKDIEDRKNIANMIKRMYKVRSSVVHHGKKSTFETQDLVMLQRCVRNLIVNFAEFSQSHTRKDTILKDIDDAIHKAY